jgi:hypothetical protein
MILSVLYFFFALIFLLIFLGYWQNESMFVVVGFALMFVIGTAGMIEGLQIQTGYEDDRVNSQKHIITYTYTTYEPQSWFGFRPFFWISVLGAFGLAVTFIDFNERFKRRRYGDEEQ